MFSTLYIVHNEMYMYAGSEVKVLGMTFFPNIYSLWVHYTQANASTVLHTHLHIPS